MAPADGKAMGGGSGVGHGTAFDSKRLGARRKIRGMTGLSILRRFPFTCYAVVAAGMLIALVLTQPAGME